VIETVWMETVGAVYRRFGLAAACCAWPPPWR
jgi:hypothetical protein